MYLAEHDVLLVADLHFEKGSSFARRGMMLPPYDTRETLDALCDAVFRFDPKTVIALGDSFHDIGGPERLGDEERATLAQTCRRAATGSGSPAITTASCPKASAGEVVEEIGARIAHPAPRAGRAGAQAEIAGHLHPVGKVVMRGRATRRRCFLTDGSRCIMPALGAYAGGLNACDAAFKPLFPKGFTAHLIGSERIFAIAKSMLCRD